MFKYPQTILLRILRREEEAAQSCGTAGLRSCARAALQDGLRIYMVVRLATSTPTHQQEASLNLHAHVMLDLSVMELSRVRNAFRMSIRALEKRVHVMVVITVRFETNRRAVKPVIPASIILPYRFLVPVLARVNGCQASQKAPYRMVQATTGTTCSVRGSLQQSGRSISGSSRSIQCQTTTLY